jgi:hypothetical protein
MNHDIEKMLLEEGTWAGRVTPEMIAYAKKKYAAVRIKLGHEERPGGWQDWIDVARKELPGPWLCECGRDNEAYDKVCSLCGEERPC